jgi:hypothetical protein
VLRIFIALKNPSPGPGSNPQPLGPVTSTLTTTPPRRLETYGTRKLRDFRLTRRNVSCLYIFRNKNVLGNAFIQTTCIWVT